MENKGRYLIFLRVAQLVLMVGEAALQIYMLERLNVLAEGYNLRNDVKLSYAVGYAISTRENYYIMDELTRIADRKMYDDKRRYKAEHQM